MKLKKILGICILILLGIININAIDINLPTEIDSYNISFNNYFNYTGEITYCNITTSDNDNPTCYYGIDNITDTMTSTGAYSNDGIGVIPKYDLYIDEVYVYSSSDATSMIICNYSGSTLYSASISSHKAIFSNAKLSKGSTYRILVNGATNRWEDKTLTYNHETNNFEILGGSSLTGSFGSSEIYHITDIKVSEYIFQTNGNKTLNISINDSSGNYTSSINNDLLVNPKQYIRFYDNYRSEYVTNFTFGDYNSSSGYAEIQTYDLGLGTHSLLFTAVGYVPTNYDITFTNTSNLNQTINVTPALLSIVAYDEETLSALSDFDIQIKNGSSTITYDSVSSLTLYSSDASTLLGDLDITISKDNYTSRTYSISLDAYSIVNLNAYLLSDDEGSYIDFFIYDNNNRVAEDVLISIYQTINDSDVVIEQVITDSAGYGGVYLDPTISGQYFIVIKDGFVEQQYDIRSSTTEYVVYLKVLTDVWKSWNDGISYNIERHSTTSEPLNLTFNIVTEDNDLTLWGFKVYDEDNSLINTLQSSTNSGGSLSYEDETNSSRIKITYFYQIGDNYEDFDKYYYYYVSNYNYSSVNIVDLGEDFVETEELPNTAKAMIFIVSLVFVIAIPNKIPKLEGRGAGLMLGWGWSLLYSYVGGLHWGLTAIAIIGTGLIQFDKKTEGRL